jgi:2-C-methyl-D-erythritol 2,4-cyclodiphosphate synthase
MERVRSILGPAEVRTGIGYDIHRFSNDPERPLMLGGIHFTGHRALDGHSDADVLIHAIVDALLGAAGLGDIGVHFPCSDPQWKNEPSVTFLTYTARILEENRWKIHNVDATLVAESPKIMKRSDEILSKLAMALSIDPRKLNIKATTNELLGAIGRSEGIAAFATATIAEVIQE